MSKTANRLLLFLVGSLLLGLALDLRGQSGIYDRVGIIPGHGTFGSLPEEHIDLFTGNVTLRYRDIYLPGPNGLDVEVWRVYNSKILKDRQSGNPSVQAYPHSWIGMGWTMHMGMVHDIDTNMPVIEFPDGRRETAYLNSYGLGNNVYLTRDFSLYSKGSFETPTVLYFRNGVHWLFEARAAIEKGDGSYEIVLLVTKISSPYGHTIQIVYDPDPHYPGRVLPTIQTITDSTGRVVTFEMDSSIPKKLQRIRVTDANGEDRIFNYAIGSYSNGYYRLDSFTAPLLEPTTFEYLDGSNGLYELSRMTTSYGGVVEYSYINQTFYFNGIALDSRVVSQKRITFNPGSQATWNFTYPSYQGAATGTVQVQGPVFNTSVIYNAYTVSAPWKIGLIAARQAGDGSYSDSYNWTYQQITTTTDWIVLGTNMGKAKGPLASSVIEGRVGDASSKTEFLYERTEPKRYGLPTRINRYLGSSGPLKGSTSLVYYFEAHTGFKSRHMMEHLSQESVFSNQGQLVKKADTTYYEETGKWGALKQVKRWKGSTTFFTWDYEYTCTNPDSVHIKIDPPGYSDKETISYLYGIRSSDSLPDYAALTREINPNDSSISSERRRESGRRSYVYDNLGRITDIKFLSSDLENPNELFNRIHYNWTSGVNSVTITQGGNIVTKFWDGVGRDLGATETGEGIAVTLYSLRTLDAEGRVLTESKESIDDYQIYTYAYNAAGQVTSITDPRDETTTITYQGTTKTVTDPEGHSTTYTYGDLPGLPTQVTDAMGKTAAYSYDAAGRLTQVIFNGTRNHGYTYDGLDNVLTELHPETGTITYTYNSENLIGYKTWGGSTLGFSYDKSKRLVRTTATTGGPIDIVDYTYNGYTGRVESIIDMTTGWRRENIAYNLFGLPESEKVTIPGLASKTLTYGYDDNLNPTGWKESSNPSTGVTISNNALNVPSSVSFNQAAVVSGASYGPNKMPASITFGNGTVYSAIYNNAGMPTSVALARGGTTLYDAGYEYDGAGNILSITSSAPALTATFGYDPLNRLTSAAFSSGSPSTYSYQYDEYGNMLEARQNGGIVFSHTYNSSNQIPQIEGFVYDSRGNLITSGGNTYYWDAQNRLQYIQNTSGAVIGKYIYDDRGLRLMAVPPLPEINVRHEAVDIPDGGEAFLRGSVGQTSTETLTIYNLGDANLNISSVVIPDDPENNFDCSTPSSPILPNGSANLEIQFHPQTTGPKTATLTIACNDPNEGIYEILLFGNYEPEISIPQAPDGGTFDYGEIAIGDFWQQTFTIHNTGDKDLILYGNPIVVIDGADADQFEVISQPNDILDPLPLHIEPDLSRTFVIRFSPNSEGLKTASISISNNDWNENPYDITLEGTGIIGTDKIDDDTAFVVTSPAEGEELVPGSVHLITWTGAPEVKEVRIDFSTDNGSTYKTIVERTENTGSYPWLVPPVISGLCLVRVSSADGTAAEAETLSVEFKVKMTGGPGASGLTLRTSLPDPKISGSWAAEIAFAPDEVRKTMALSLNSAGTDAGPVASFYGKWHTVRLALDHAGCFGSLWLDGQPVLHMVPLVQGAWLGGSPFVELRTAGGSDVRVEDFEARFKDRALKPEIEGQEVSQLLVKDSFEGYPDGRFPSAGGWRSSPGAQGVSGQVLPEPPVSPSLESMYRRRARQGRRSADSTGKAREEGTSGSTEQTGRDATPEKRETYVDGEDSVTGLRSLVFSGHEPVEIVLFKPLELPATAPFGVSEGNFAVGEAPESTNGRTLSRSRVLDRLRREDGKGRTRRDDESTLGNGAHQPEKAVNPQRAVTSSAAFGASSKSTKLMSASPVGNYYLYSFDGRLLQVYDVFGVLQKDFVYMGSRLVAEYDHVNRRLLYYTPDQIDSTRVVTDGVGNVVYSATYDPYGNIRTETGSIDPLPKFSGKERDTESQLDYFGARYYASLNYRWISVDPTTSKSGAIGDPQRWNLYSYCGNNPLVFFDPNGNDQVNVFLAFNKSELKLDFNALQAIAKANGHNVTVYERGTYTQSDFEKSVEAKDTWTFYVGHSTAVNKETKKRAGILMPGKTVGEQNIGLGWLTDWVRSNNEYVGIFACSSVDYAFDLFQLANNVIATNNNLEPKSTGLEAGAYYTLELLLQGSDLDHAMQIGTGFWSWAILGGWVIEPPAIVSNTTKK